MNTDYIEVDTMIKIKTNGICFFVTLLVAFTVALSQVNADETTVQAMLANAKEASLSGDIKSAIEIYQEVITKYPGSKTASWAKSTLEVIERHSDYNYEPLKKMFKVNELVFQGMGALSEEKPSEDYFRKSIKGYQQILNEYPNCSLSSQLHVSIACGYKECKEYDKAIKLFKEVMVNYPNSQQAMTAQLMLARIYNYELKDYDKAVEAYKAYIDMHPTQEEIDLIKTAIQGIYMNQGKDDLYVSMLMEEINKAPGTRRAGAYYIMIADYYYGKKNYDKAISIYEKTIKDYSDPEWRLTEGVFNLLGRYYFEVKGDYEKALMYYEKLTKEYPDSKRLKWSQPDIDFIKKAIEEKKDKGKGMEKSVDDKTSTEKK